MDEARFGRDQGASLIIAIVFMLAISVVAIALAGFSVQSSVTSVNAHQQAAVEANAESGATAAIELVRFSYGSSAYSTSVLNGVPQFSSPQSCMPAGAASAVVVYCEGYQNGPYRTVEFFVCNSAVSSPAACVAQNSSAVLLFATASFTDIPNGGGPSSVACSASSSATCGISMTVGTWDVRTADL